MVWHKLYSNLYSFQITLRVFARILCLGKMANEVRVIRNSWVRQRKSNSCCERMTSLGRLLCCYKPNKSNDEESCNEKLANHNTDCVSREPVTPMGLENHMSEIRKSIQRMEMKMEEKQLLQNKEFIISLEWKCIASVLDRCFFVLYVILIVVSLFCFFPRPI